MFRGKYKLIKLLLIKIGILHTEQSVSGSFSNTFVTVHKRVTRFTIDSKQEQIKVETIKYYT